MVLMKLKCLSFKKDKYILREFRNYLEDDIIRLDKRLETYETHKF